MKLHKNNADFNALINIASRKSGISADIIEKDYYVTLILKELANKQDDINAYFKGGTCLYKVYAPLKRFSEDIDLTVQAEGLSKSKTKRNLKQSSKGYTCLEKDDKNEANEDKKGSITQVYNYKSIFEVPQDPLQRYEKVKVESTSFTISEPVEENYINALMIDLLPDDIANQLKQKYDMHDFKIKNITLERIFCDKLLAAEFYSERDMNFDVAKHVYDIISMLQMPRIQKMLNDKDEFIQNLAYKRIEETIRTGSDLWNKSFKDFVLYSKIKETQFMLDFNNMQEKYVFNDTYKYNIEKAKDIMLYLEQLLYEIDTHEQKILNSEEFLCWINNYNPDFVINSNNKNGTNAGDNLDVGDDMDDNGLNTTDDYDHDNELDLIDNYDDGFDPADDD